jgi:adenosylcobinamide kinase / adenosylcobinamide-phosphate guanylyltransferase
MLILVTGGSRSGKSGYALERGEQCVQPRIFVATAQAFDEEMARRIEAHRKARPAGWDLAEEPFEVAAALEAGLARHRTVVVDCVTLWMSNLLLRDDTFGEAEAARCAESLVAAAARAPGSTVIVVTNEVGSGIVPDNRLARRFRDCAGRANQVIGRAAHEVQLLVSGIAMRIKPNREGFNG